MPPSTTDTLNRTIAPKDTMYVPAQAEEYFWVGRSALSCVELAVQAAGKKPSDIQSVLDFPCGHGRVLRHLKLAYPNAEFTVCDLDRDGVDFCASTFSATGVYSHVDPDKIPLRPASFDLIWVGSLLTHFDAPRWVPFLRSLSSWLRPGGILAFSVHGRTTHAWMENKVYDYALPAPVMADVISQYRKTGFGYVKYVGSPEDYGVSLSTPSWVTARLAEVPDLRLVHYVEGGWVRHHDVISCMRGPIFWPNG